MKSSYKKEDVTILLNDVTGLISPISQEERAKRVAQGEYVRSIIIEEYPISKEYTDIVVSNMKPYLPKMAETVGVLAETLYRKKSNKLVLVDIARAGLPIGILVKRYIKKYYNIDIPHYSISLVQGLDPIAMDYIIQNHGTEGIQFIDGWTGKGTVAKEIKKCVEENYPGIDSGLAVLSDCINVAPYIGTREDIYIPHSPLNASATGLVSITVKNPSFENPSGFHSAIYLENLEGDDISNWFLSQVEKYFKKQTLTIVSSDQIIDVNEIDKVSMAIHRDKKLLNPGINEAARAILRRKLECLLVQNKKDKELEVLILLAKEKGVLVEEYPLKGYKAISVANDNYIR